MKVSLELYRQSKKKDYPHPLVIRFAVRGDTYRYPLDKHFTDDAWLIEQKTGYKNAGDAVDLERKAVTLLKDIDPRFWTYKEFVESMDLPIIPKDAITKLWKLYDHHRDRKHEKGLIAWRTRELDTTVKNKVEKFLRKYPALNNVHMWKAVQLQSFENFLLNDEGHPQSTTKIYLETFRTFFSWCVNGEDDDSGNVIIDPVLARSPFSKFKIKKGSESWFPYSFNELKVMMSLEPENDRERFAIRWTKLILYAGGADPMDFVEMRWRQIQSEAIQFNRVKVSKTSKAGNKLLYLTPDVVDLFDEIKTDRGKPDDYVLPVFKAELTERQNIDRHKRFMDKIKEGMRSMIARYNSAMIGSGQKPFHLDFVIKRLRPTAAVMANGATKDVNFVKLMLMHSTLTQTTVYLSRYPDDEIKKMQGIYEEALKLAMG